MATQAIDISAGLTPKNPTPITAVSPAASPSVDITAGLQPKQSFGSEAKNVLTKGVQTLSNIVVPPYIKSFEKTPMGKNLSQSVSEQIHDPEKRSQLAVGLVQPESEMGTGVENAAKDVVEKLGLKYKGELTPGSGVHMIEHPDHPGKTAAIKEPFMAEDVQAAMDRKLKEFDVKSEKEPVSINPLHEQKGLPKVDLTKISVDKETASKIADAYDAMKHDPNNPEVRKAYDALIRDTKEQWKYAQDKLGMKMTVHPEQPYENAEDMIKDIKENRHIGVWSGEGDMPSSHPMHEVDPETGISNNTLFRAVHDIFGHAAGENDFSEGGEENAYNLHKQSYNQEAIPALATETRGQANYFFHNKEAPGEKFPTQKAGLLPAEFHAGGGTPEELEKTGTEIGRTALQQKWENILKGEGLGETPKTNAPEVLDNIAKQYGTSADASKTRNGTSFITPDGKFIHLGTVDHPQVLFKHGYDAGTNDDRVPFINDSHSIRTNFTIGRAGNTLSMSVPKDGITEEQIDAMKAAVHKGLGRNGQLRIETAESPTNVKNEIKDFATANDIEPILEKLGVHPGEKAAWAQQTAEKLKTQDSGAIDPRTNKPDTSGFGVEIYPEAKQRFATQPTAKEIDKFYQDNKPLFDKHPELRVGWDKDLNHPSGKPWELNIGAAGNNTAGAELVARRLDQRSAFDIAKGESIPTSGKNQKIKFPQYSLEDRLNDLTGKHVEKLPPAIKNSPYLTDDEKYLLASNDTHLKNYNETKKKIATPAELSETMKAGQANRFWYERAQKVIQGLVDSKAIPEEDRGRFTALLAATSPQSDPAVNSQFALRGYKSWIDAGRPTDVTKIRKVVDPALMMPSTHGPNAARALAGQELSGPKVSSFNINLTPNELNPKSKMNVTNDMWGAITNGIVEQKDLSDPGTYIAVSENYRKAASKLGWEPKQGQAASWGFVRTLGYASGWKGQGEFKPPGEIVKLINDPLVRKYSADIADIFLNDPEVRNRVEALGVNLDEFDTNLKKSIKDLGRGGEGKAEKLNPRLLAKTAERVQTAKIYARSQAEAGKRVAGKMSGLFEEGGKGLGKK